MHVSIGASDLQLTTNSLLVVSPAPQQSAFNFIVDGIAQESPETASLQLMSIVPLEALFDLNNNAFFINALQLTIIDSDGKLTLSIIPIN